MIVQGGDSLSNLVITTKKSHTKSINFSTPSVLNVQKCFFKIHHIWYCIFNHMGVNVFTKFHVACGCLDITVLPHTTLPPLPSPSPSTTLLTPLHSKFDSEFRSYVKSCANFFPEIPPSSSPSHLRICISSELLTPSAERGWGEGDWTSFLWN